MVLYMCLNEKSEWSCICVLMRRVSGPVYVSLGEE